MRSELSLVNGFMDSPAASRAKVRFPSSPFFFRSRASPTSFFLHPVCSPEHRVSHGLSMQPRCGRSCHCSGDRYPSSQLRVKVTTLYLESQLMPPPLSRDHPLIIDEPPPFLRSSCGIYRCPFPLSPRHSSSLRECLKKEHALMENRNR